MGNDLKFVFVAYAPCGCISGARADLPNDPIGNATFVMEMLRDGDRIQRQPIPPPVTLGDDCPHEPKWGKSDA